MTSTDLATDGAVIVRTLAAPSRGLSEVVDRRRSLTAIAVATVASLAFAAAAVPRVDHARAAAARIDAPMVKPGEKPPEMTPHEREEALATASKLGQVAGWAGAALLPALLAAGAAAALWLGFRVAGTKPGFRDALAATAHGLLPVWAAKVLAIPAALVRAPIRLEELDGLVPSSAAALLPPGAPPAVAGALGALDLFALWAVVLVAGGMARASGASRRRALAVTVVLYAAWIAVARISIPALVAGPGGGP